MYYYISGWIKYYQWDGSQWIYMGLVPGDINSVSFMSLTPFVTYDGQKLYYSREVGSGNYKIYVATWDGSGFNNSVPLGSQINNPYGYNPSLTQDMQKLYYQKNSGGYIYESTWNGSDWGSPIQLPPEVNAGGSRTYPKITPDGNELYFSGAGIWYRYLAFSRKIGGVWQQWQYCDYNINPPGSTEYVSSPTFTYNTYENQKLYFMRSLTTTSYFYAFRSPTSVQPASIGQIKASYAR